MRPLSAAVWLLLSVTSLAQSISTTNINVVTGYVAPQLIDDFLIYDESSAPKVQAAALINVDLPEGSKVFDIWADKIPSMDLADLKPIGNNYLLVGEGKYRITCYFEPKAIKRLEVVIGKAPAPTPEPTPIPTSDLSVGARTAVLSFVHSMAGNFDTLAKDKAKFKTVTEASTVSNALDLVSRQKFKQDMGAIMQPRLGSTDLPADADQVFKDIADGFRSVK